MPEFVSDRHRAVIAAVCETLLPGTSAGPDRVEHLIASLSDPGDRRRLLLVLSALDSPFVNLALSGRYASFVDMPPAVREAVLRGWAFSRLPQRRAAFQALKRLAHVAYYCWPTEDTSHPMWRAAGYPGPLPAPAAAIEPLPTVAVDRDTVLDCDVVVVGSGAGGGVAAAVLAQAGRSVVVLEKGGNLSSRDMTQIEGDMLGSLYLDGGLVMTQSGSLPILAGSCLGGGTVINYTTSFPLPDRVRAEWDARSGLALFSSPRFAESLARVCARLNVGTRWTTPGVRDALLERGCRALGWHVDRIPRNVTDCREGLECGYCGYGCRHGAKNSTARTYLADAARSGARLVVRCDVERVIRAGGRATGVVGSVRAPDGTPRRLTVHGRAVVVAAGSLHTPALLLRSGLENPNIGRNLHLHPATAVGGFFAQRIEPWGGALQTRYSDQFADQGGGYGTKFETAPVHFALPASGFGWEGARQHRDDIGRLAHLSIVGVLLRDRDAGRVTVSREGRPRVHYELSRGDAAHVRRGLLGAAQVLAAAGAQELFTLQTPPARARPGEGEGSWLDRLARDADARGYRRCRMSYISFHQMGSAALGRDPARSVAGETGEAHGLRGLYIADASTFPTSSGVNPMITIMAIADHVARAVADAW
jgi:choline dehydrogenase-like flavoprotein